MKLVKTEGTQAGSQGCTQRNGPLAWRQGRNFRRARGIFQQGIWGRERYKAQEEKTREELSRKRDGHNLSVVLSDWCVLLHLHSPP